MEPYADSPIRETIRKKNEEQAESGIKEEASRLIASCNQATRMGQCVFETNDQGSVQVNFRNPPKPGLGKYFRKHLKFLFTHFFSIGMLTFWPLYFMMMAIAVPPPSDEISAFIVLALCPVGLFFAVRITLKAIAEEDAKENNDAYIKRINDGTCAYMHAVAEELRRNAEKKTLSEVRQYDLDVENARNRLLNSGVSLDNLLDCAMDYLNDCFSRTNQSSSVETIVLPFGYSVSMGGVSFCSGNNPTEWFSFDSHRMQNLGTTQMQEGFAQGLAVKLSERMKRDFFSDLQRKGMDYKVQTGHQDASLSLTIRIKNRYYVPVKTW